MRWKAITGFLAAALLLIAATPSPAKSPRAGTALLQKVRIIAVYGKRTLVAGEPGNFRVRVAPGATQPIEYFWQSEGETIAEGVLVTLHFLKTGRYIVTVTARNKYGRDLDTLLVTVTAPPSGNAFEEDTNAASRPTEPHAGQPKPSTRPVALNSGLHAEEAFVWPRSGYTWVIATHLHSQTADLDAQGYRAAGYRTGIVVDDGGSGSPAYRIVVGYFSTQEAALRARPMLPANRPGGIWLLNLADVPAK